MEKPTVRGVGSQQIPRLEISLREPDREFLMNLRGAYPNSAAAITLLIIIANKRSAIEQQVALLRKLVEEQPDNATVQKNLEKHSENLKEITAQLRNHYSELCRLHLGNVFSELKIGDNHIEEDFSAPGIVINGLSPEDRIALCQRMWQMEFIARLTTNDRFILLEPDQLNEELKKIPDWTPDERRQLVARTFTCKNTEEAASFAAEAARLTKLWRQDTHIDQNNHAVTITVTTPSMKGLTAENIQYAMSVSTVHRRRYTC